METTKKKIGDTFSIPKWLVDDSMLYPHDTMKPPIFGAKKLLRPELGPFGPFGPTPHGRPPEVVRPAPGPSVTPCIPLGRIGDLGDRWPQWRSSTWEIHRFLAVENERWLNIPGSLSGISTLQVVFMSSSQKRCSENYMHFC